MEDQQAHKLVIQQAKVIQNLDAGMNAYRLEMSPAFRDNKFYLGPMESRNGDLCLKNPETVNLSV